MSDQVQFQPLYSNQRGSHGSTTRHAASKEPASRSTTDHSVKIHTQKTGKKTRHKSRISTIFAPLLKVALFAFFCFVLYRAYVFYQQQQIPIPEEIQEFVSEYPEAKPFLKNYRKSYEKTFEIDTQKEIESSDIPLFIQWDKRWGYQAYGSKMIGTSGCGPTCLSMVCSGLTKDSSYTPLFMANFSNEQGYYLDGQGTSWNLMTEGAKQFGLSVENGTISAEYITSHLSSEHPIICSMLPGDFTKSGHFIVLTGIDSEGKILVNDPNSPKNSKTAWDLSQLLPQIKGLWCYSYSS